MKICIGFRPISGPYGGGNNFVKSLSSRLQRDGFKVVHSLKDKDIDIILLINPLVTSEFATFNNFDIDYYQTFINKKAISIQRFNDCDERKDTNFINKKLIKKNKNVDFNIFVSSWIKNLFDKALSSTPNFVIRGGPDSKIFNSKNHIKWTGNLPLKIVTHHWSSHENKGFDIYSKIDDLLDSDYWKSRIEFTLIGNYPENIVFKNTKLLPPLESHKLSKELQKNHIYITASKNEPSGNHHMEGILCGLPILYIDSGGVTEYCKDFGIEYNEKNLDIKLNEILDNYPKYYKEIKNYPYDFNYMYSLYLKLFDELYKSRDKLFNKRNKDLKAKVFVNYFINKCYKKFREIVIYFKVKLGKLKKKL